MVNIAHRASFEPKTDIFQARMLSITLARISDVITLCRATYVHCLQSTTSAHLVFSIGNYHLRWLIVGVLLTGVLCFQIRMAPDLWQYTHAVLIELPNWETWLAIPEPDIPHSYITQSFFYPNNAERLARKRHIFWFHLTKVKNHSFPQNPTLLPQLIRPWRLVIYSGHL